MRIYFWNSLLALLLLGGAMTGCAVAQESGAAQRIVAVGDIHGDYDAYESIVIAAGLSDARGRWTGGDAIFIQTGDIADRGPDSRKIIEHLRKLQKRAAKKGGAVITLVGNHEAMNVIGDLRYVHSGEYEAFQTRNSKKLRDKFYADNRNAFETHFLENVDASLSSEAIREKVFEEWPLGRIEHNAAWSPSGEIGAWVSENPAVAKVGDTLFVHGGISAEYSVFSLDDINARVGAALAAQDDAPESIIVDELGPLWYRGLVMRDNAASIQDAIDAAESGGAVVIPDRPTMEEEISIVLGAYNASRIVVGHTPNIENIRPGLGGRIIQIDTGASKHYGGVAAYLEIIGDKITAHNVSAGEAWTISATGEMMK